MGNKRSGIQVPSGIECRPNQDGTATLSFKFYWNGKQRRAPEKRRFPLTELTELENGEQWVSGSGVVALRELVNKRNTVLNKIEANTFDPAIEFPGTEFARDFGKSVHSLLTAEECWEEWLTAAARTNDDSGEPRDDASTLKEYRAVLKRVWSESVGKLPLRDLMKHNITLAMKDLDIGRQTARQYLVPLAAALSWATTMGYIEVNPIRQIEWKNVFNTFPSTGRDPEPFDVEERQAIIASANVLYPSMANAIEAWFWLGL